MKHALVYRAILVSGLFAALTGSPVFQTSEKDVLEKFCELDANGGQMNVEGLKALSGLFTEPAQSRPKTAIIIKDYVVLSSSKAGDGAEFDVEYVYLGRLNLSLARYSRLPASYPPGPVKVRVPYKLTHSTTHSGAGTPPSSEWKIKGEPPEPRITVEAAIRCLTDLKRRSASVNIQKDADKTIATLRRLQ